MKPPPALEFLVGLLIPPACREEVLGDLHERCTGLASYLADAAAAGPLVILSRIRRTSDPQIRLMEAFVFYLSLVLAAWGLERNLLAGPLGLWRLGIPAAVALFTLVLADAYADPRRRSPLQPVEGVALAVGFAFLSQAILSAGNARLALPLSIMVWGGGSGLFLACAVRLLFPPPGMQPQNASMPAYWQRRTGEALKLGRGVILLFALVVVTLVAAYHFTKGGP